MQKIVAHGLKNMQTYEPVTESCCDSRDQSCKVSKIGTQAMTDISAQEKTEEIINGVRRVTLERGGVEEGNSIQVTPSVPLSVNKGEASLASEVNAEDMDIFSSTEIVEIIMDVHPRKRAEVVRIAASLIKEGMKPAEKTCIVTAIAGIPELVTEADLALASSVDPKMGSYGSMKILKAVMDVPEHKRVQVVRSAAFLIKEGMEPFGRSYIIGAIDNMPVPVTEADTALASLVVALRMGYLERIELLEAVMNVSAQKRAEVVRIAASLITERMSFSDRSYIIEAIDNMPEPVTEADVALASKVFDEETCLSIVVAILRAVMDVPAQKRESLIEEALQLSAHQEKIFKIMTIMRHLGIPYEVGHVQMIGTQAMTDISAQEKTEEIINGVRRVTLERGGVEEGNTIQVTPSLPLSVNKGEASFASEVNAEDMDIFSSTEIVEIIMDVHPRKRAEVVRIAASLIKEGMKPAEKTCIVTAIAGIPELVTEADLALASSVDPKMGSYGSMEILKAVMDVPEHKRVQVVRSAAFLIKEGMEPFGRSYIIGAIDNMPVPVTEADTALASLLIPLRMGYLERIELLGAVMKVPAQKRAQVVRSAASLMKEQLSLSDRRYIIEAIDSMPEPVTEADVALASKVFDEETCLSIVVAILRAVMDVPAQKRESLIEEALQLSAHQEKVFKIMTIMHHLGISYEVGHVQMTQRVAASLE